MIHYILDKAKASFALPAKKSGYAYNGYGDREDYYQNLLTERSAESLLHWLTLKEEAVFNPDIQLKFRDIDFRATTRDIRKQLGKPRFTIKNPQVDHHEVYFYRFRLGRLHSVAAIHFFENEFFLATHTFRQLNAQNYQQVLQVLANKYGVVSLPEDMGVKDRHGNTIVVADGLYLTVKYISGDPYFLNRITQLCEQKKQYKQRREEKSLSSINNFL